MLVLTLASLRLHRRRYTAAALATLLGVAFLTVTLSVTQAAKRGIGDALVQQYSAADVVVTSPSGKIPDRLAAGVAGLPQTGSSAVIHTDTYAVHWPRSSDTSYVEVGEIPGPTALRWQPLDGGRYPAEADEVVIDSATAAAEGPKAGSTLTLSGLGSRGTDHRVTVVGLVDLQSAITGSGGVFTAAGALAAWSPRAGSAELVASAKPGVSPDELRDAISRFDTAGVVQTADHLRTEATSSLTDGIDVLGLFFQAFAIIALFVAALVIANTFTIVLAQRSRDLAPDEMRGRQAEPGAEDHPAGGTRSWCCRGRRRHRGRSRAGRVAGDDRRSDSSAGAASPVRAARV